MADQLAVGGEQLRLFQFQQAFRGKPGAAFFGQFGDETHACPFRMTQDRRCRHAPASTSKVNPR